MPAALVLALCAALVSCSAEPPAIEPSSPAPPRIILFVGDGMGLEHERAASHYATGADDALSWHAMSARATLSTSSLDGTTDSAAAATAMATGVLTRNGRVGRDELGADVESILELAKRRGMATGVVTTAALAHATPAAFTAHHDDRNEMREIAEQQARETRPDVLLGGGQLHYASVNGSPSLFAELGLAGYDAVYDAAGLTAIDTASTDKLVGSFSVLHFPFVSDRGNTVPSLEAMTQVAIDILERDPDGFFLLVEAGRIDHASHGNDLADAIAETLELDRAVALARTWAESQTNTTLIVASDHETGGLGIDAPAPMGVLPAVTWTSTEHTSIAVGAYAEGPGASVIELGGDLRVIHRALRAALLAATAVPTASCEAHRAAASE